MGKDSAAGIELGRSFHQRGTVNEKVSESDFVPPWDTLNTLRGTQKCAFFFFFLQTLHFYYIATLYSEHYWNISPKPFCQPVRSASELSVPSSWWASGGPGPLSPTPFLPPAAHDPPQHCSTNHKPSWASDLTSSHQPHDAAKVTLEM